MEELERDLLKLLRSSRELIEDREWCCFDFGDRGNGTFTTEPTDFVIVANTRGRVGAGETEALRSIGEPSSRLSMLGVDDRERERDNEDFREPVKGDRCPGDSLPGERRPWATSEVGNTSVRAERGVQLGELSSVIWENEKVEGGRSRA